MKSVWGLLVLVVTVSLAGCASNKHINGSMERIGEDLEWVFLDNE